MTSYRFDGIMINRQSMFVAMSPLVGATLGFFMTLAKTPPMILRDSVYGAFLGLLGSIAFLLFEMSLAKYPIEESNGSQGSQDGPVSEGSEGSQGSQGSQEETESEKATLQRIMSQLNELGQDRQRLMRARVAKMLEGPVSMRTRSQIASLK